MKYLLYYFVFSLIVIAFAYFNSVHNNKESFTPNFKRKMKQTINPFVRDTRIGLEKFKNNSVNKLSNIIDGLI